MERERVEVIFEAFFEKYKKTEGDRTAWSAVWLETNDKGVLEINMTKCPRGTVFKLFVNRGKVAEVIGWDGFFAAAAQLEDSHPGIYDEGKIFSEMEFVL
ncbi:hypothetical protein [Maridesulfovibrio sp. FT414]|uniref:hypothetical protein n=1 Tax=Maridesulfovibrio sp. FT414 TaxID=2979469 RepID=UPI003D802023